MLLIAFAVSFREGIGFRFYGSMGEVLDGSKGYWSTTSLTGHDDDHGFTPKHLGRVSYMIIDDADAICFFFWGG